MPKQNSRVVVDADRGTQKISRHIYGHFAEHLGACVYEGMWVGHDSPIPNTRGIRNDVIEAFREIRMPVLRWPGGNFADDYHWQDGIGRYENRKPMVNAHWGQVVENNHFGTHEFMDLCELVGCEPYVCGNVGSGTVREMRDWVEYLTFDGQTPMTKLRRANGREKPWRVKYLAVGNENWGAGGCMRPEFYADLYRQYARFCFDFSGNHLYKVASGAAGPDYSWTIPWTETLLKQAHWHMDGLSLHYYCDVRKPGQKNTATQFGEPQWFETLHQALRMDEIIRRHVAIMDQYDPENRIGLIVDEWGTWYDPEPGTNPAFLYQQNTLRDALVAGTSLNIFNNRANRVHMANLAQTVNVLQSVVLTDGPRMVLTPTYHVFEMYKVHQDAALLPTHLECPEYRLGDRSLPSLSVSASRNESNTVHVSICNLDPHDPKDVCCEVRGMETTSAMSRVLTAGAMNAHNTFDKPGEVVVVPADIRHENGECRLTVPPMSVVVVAVK